MPHDVGRRLAVRTAMEHPISSLPRTPFPASRDFPSRGNERYEGKTASHILHVPFRRFPSLVAGALWTSPAGLRVDGPLGRRFLKGLSLTRLWCEGCCRAPINYRRRPLMKKPLQPPCGRQKCIPPLVAGATTLPGGKHVTGFSVAYGSLRIVFPCHPCSGGRIKHRETLSS